MYGYQLDRAGYDRMLEKFSDEQLNVTAYDTTSLSGHIDVKEDGLLFLSIPYAEGWSAEVDGEKAEIVSIQDALMGIRLNAGSHDISLKYTPAGFKAGLLISLVSITMIAGIILVSHLISKKKEGKAAVETAEASSVPVQANVPEQTAENTAATPEVKAEEPIEEVPVAAVMADPDDFSATLAELKDNYDSYADKCSDPEVDNE